jgi:hypothetical protein
MSGMNAGFSGDGDLKDIVLAVIKEMTKTSKFVHKNDIYTMLRGKYDDKSFERALDRLLDDGAIFTAYDKDIFGLEE